ncbi:MAG: tetratricopeptide repeat protein [Crocinitomicaceae bacterium]|nr:tetratricopeptide repeat protein [Crocinitomicaceae bacterium]
MRVPVFLALIFFLLTQRALCVNVDSIRQVAINSSDVNAQLKAMLSLSSYYLRTDTLASKQWSATALSLAREEKNISGIILSHESFGRYYTEQGRYDSALYYLEYAIANYNTSDFANEIAACYISIGNVYDIQSDYQKALEAYLKAEEQYQVNNYKHGIGLAQMGIGNIYTTTGQHDEAKIYFRRSYQNLLELSEIYASWSMNNLATAMTELGEYDSAIFFFEKSLEIKLKNNDVYGASYTYTDLGALYFKLNEFDLALSYYLKALETKETLEGISKETLSKSYLDMGTIYYKKKNYLSAIFYAEQSLNYAIDCSSVLYQSHAFELLADLYQVTGDYKKGCEMLSTLIELKDSVQKSLYNQNLSELRTKYDLEQKQKEIELLNTSNRLSQLEAEQARAKTRVMMFYLIGSVVVILVVTILGISLFRTVRAKNLANTLLKKTNTEVQLQKEIVEEKNKEIMDSINYAKRIQNAILPSTRIIAENLPQSFILYKPKDIVAGDFYWLEKREDLIFFAAADCTGHGVPGAMVSVICNNGLNRSVREHKITDPGKILDKTREIIICEFEKSDDEVKDGMDISLVVLQKNPIAQDDIKDQRYLLKWAGANNPLWIFRKEKEEIEEIKADKQPIGKFSAGTPFTTHTLEVCTGDTLYIFTDGFQDQFGGEKGKKYKSANFKNLLLSIANQPMDIQKQLLAENLESWRGTLEQVDDVCVVGVRV